MIHQPVWYWWVTSDKFLLIKKELSLDTFGQTTASMTSVCSRICWVKIDVCFIINNNIKMYIYFFWLDIFFFNKHLYITFIWFINQFLCDQYDTILFTYKSRNWTLDINKNNAMYIVPFFFCRLYSFLSIFFFFGLDSLKVILLSFPSHIKLSTLPQVIPTQITNLNPLFVSLK